MGEAKLRSPTFAKSGDVGSDQIVGSRVPSRYWHDDNAYACYCVLVTRCDDWEKDR